MATSRRKKSARPLAVVTGASAGIGAEFCRQLAAAGHDLVLVARNAQRLARFGKDLARAHGVAAEPLAADLGVRADLLKVESRLAAEERLVMLVNNAGFGFDEGFLEAEADRHEEMIRVHVLASVRLARAALPGMVRREKGAVVNVSSVAAFAPSSGSVTYGATKAFLNHFTEGLAIELAGTQVKVQALCPGFTRTEFHARARIDPGRIPDFLWLSAEEVVSSSLAGLERGEAICVPSARYKALAAVLPLVPRSLVRAVARKLVDV